MQIMVGLNDWIIGLNSCQCEMSPFVFHCSMLMLDVRVFVVVWLFCDVLFILCQLWVP